MLHSCEVCGCKIRRFRWSKEKKMVCYKCYKKSFNIISISMWQGFSFEKAIAREYEVKGYVCGDGSIHANINVPSILAGHKVKLTVIK